MSNVYTLFEDCSRHGNSFILSPNGEPLYTYADLREESARYAHLLKQAGVAPGDRVMVQVQKSPQNLFLYFGCLRAGAIYLPLNTAYTEDELTYFIGNASPSVIVAEDTRTGFFESASDARVFSLSAEGTGTLVDQLPTQPVTPYTAEVDGDDPAVILYTSGTTGRPKGAMITHDNLASNGLTLLDAWQWQAGDVLLHALPIFHIHGLFVATHLAVLNASPMIFLSGFDPAKVIENLPRATVYMGVPTNYVRLLATGDLTPETCGNMRLFTAGSAPLLPQTFTAFHEATGHEIVERYGMTETGMNTSNPLDGERKPGTVGPPLPGVETQIVDENDAPVPSGETGYLKVRGKNVFKGYWQMPEKTAEEFDAEGYFRTGDMASCDDDGYVSIVGRGKDLIISGGLNVYPKELEGIIDRMPGVLESAVIGLPHPDFGEGVCAVIVPSGDVTLEEAELISELKIKVANFKVPKWVYFVDALPRNTMGKVQKNVLRDQFTPAGDN